MKVYATTAQENALEIEQAHSLSLNKAWALKNEPRLDPKPDILQPGYLVLSVESKLAELFYNHGSAKPCPYLVRA